jgi:hypothetical protein
MKQDDIEGLKQVRGVAGVGNKNDVVMVSITYKFEAVVGAVTIEEEEAGFAVSAALRPGIKHREKKMRALGALRA